MNEGRISNACKLASSASTRIDIKDFWGAAIDATGRPWLR